MTFCAIGGKTGFSVIGVDRSLEIVQMTTHTVISDAVEPERRFAGMTFSAIQGLMHPRERKTVFKVQFRNIVHQPVIGAVASGAVISYGLLVYICMAGNTIGACF